MDVPMLNDQAMTRDSLYGTAAESTYAGITSFMRRRYSRDLRGVDVAVSGVPFDTATSNRPGARFGPRGIRAASTGIAWERHWPWAFDPFDHLAVIDYGDCDFDYGSPHTIPESIEAHAERILDAGSAMLTFGGDHFITYPLLKAHARKHGALSLIHFDAHSDTWPDEEGKRVDHGTCSGTPRRKVWWIRRARCRSVCAPPMTIIRALPCLMHVRYIGVAARRLSRQFAHGLAITRCT